MNYTDKELIRASQIAYLTINFEVIKEVFDNINKINENNPELKIELNYTLSELFEYSDTFRRSIYGDISKATGFTVTESDNRTDVLNRIESDVIRRSVAEKYDIIDDIKTGEIGKWKVVSYVDNNDMAKNGMAGRLVDGNWYHTPFSSSGDGLAAMVFETSEGNAITAFRGSEDMTSVNNLKKFYLNL